MYMLQLFDKADEFAPVDQRLLDAGVLRIGRDAGADWTIEDPDRALSRAHCEIQADAAGLQLRVLGINGMFDDRSGARLPESVPLPLPLPGAVRLGRYRLVASHIEPPASAVEPGAATAPSGGSLLEAFCRGAGLDPSQLSGEDPVAVMTRAGAIHRQLVQGVGELMAERDAARARYGITRTTIGAVHNNLFKWAPSQRLAVDLLLAGPSGFLSGPAAVKASFADLKRHLAATAAGIGASLRRAVDRFDPAAIDAAVADRSSLLKSRAAMQAEEAAGRHAELDRELRGGSGGTLDEAFAAAYAAAERTAA